MLRKIIPRVKKDATTIPKLDERVSGDELLNAEDFVDVLYRYGFYNKYGEDFDILSDNGIDTAKSYLEETEAPRGAIDTAEDLKELETERDNAFDLWQELKNRSSGELYESTPGEIEARDVSSRLDMTAEERKNTRPDIDRTDVVFADGSTYHTSAYADNFSEQIDE